MSTLAKNVVDDALKLDPPTVQSGTGWLICNSSLGCGSRVLQGWSKGIGISAENKNNFEERLFKLLYLSKHPDYTKTRWNLKGLGRNVEAPISVGMHRYQFLTPKTTYIMSSVSDWIERFRVFVETHKLGDFSVGHEWKNPHHTGDLNRYASWTWNGNVPKAADVGLKNWSLPE